MDRRLLEYYNEELRHLRGMAAEFARDYPKIAGRLSLSTDELPCDDPYVERLLEGFAFLAARVHLKLDSEFPRFTQGLLETVYPDYLCPIPAMTIVRFQPELSDGSLAPGFLVPRKTQLRSQIGKGERTACTFTTAHDVRLLPLEVVEARYFVRDLAELNLPATLRAKAAFRLRLRKTIPEKFGKIHVAPLSIYLRGNDELPGLLYEQLAAHKQGLIVQIPGQPGFVATYPVACVQPAGFAGDQALLPRAPEGFEGYRLLREYFAFPERFLFFEFSGFESALEKIKDDVIDLVVPLKELDPRLEGRVDESSVALFCTPAINLFEKTLDRIPISERLAEFQLIPDRPRPLDFEIYKLLSVAGYGEKTDQEKPFYPFYQARDAGAEERSFYSLNRVPRLLSEHERTAGRSRSDYGGVDTYISIVDHDMVPAKTSIRQLGIRALCTNRHLPIQMPKGIATKDVGAKGVDARDFSVKDFEIDKFSAPVAATKIVSRVTLPKPSLVVNGAATGTVQIPDGRFTWRLISHLSLNYLSLLNSGANGGAEAFRDILKLYADPGDRQCLRLIDGLRTIQSKPITRRVPVPGPICFARGLEINVELDETVFEGTGAFVFCSVLEEFFARYVSLNSFTETVFTSVQRKEVMRWLPRMGQRQLV